LFKRERGRRREERGGAVQRRDSFSGLFKREKRREREGADQRRYSFSGLFKRKRRGRREERERERELTREDIHFQVCSREKEEEENKKNMRKRAGYQRRDSFSGLFKRKRREKRGRRE
jgi:hypothetical protein